MLVNDKWKGPIVDQHMHLDKTNRFLRAAEEFSNAGGTGIFLVHKPSFSTSLPRDINDYRGAYQETLNMASKVRKKIGLDVQVVLGPHPVTWDIQANTMGIEESTELHISAVGLALEMIEDGDAICLGEVGRPHYQVSEERWEKANEMLLEIMRMASSALSLIHISEPTRPY